MTAGRLRLAKNLAHLGAGSVVAQVLTLALTPVITRLYTPADLGVLATLVAIGSVLFPIATLRLDLAVLLPKDPCEAESIVTLICRISFWVSMIAALSVLALKSVNVTATNPNLTYEMLLSIAPAVWFNSLNSAFAASATREGRFGRLAAANVVGALISNGFRVCLGLSGWGAWGLWVANISQFVASVLWLRPNVAKITIQRRLQGLSLLRKYREMPAYRMPQDLFNALASNAVNVIMLVVYGASQVGLYALAFKLAAAPVDLAKGTIRSVFYKHAVDSPNARSLYRDTLGLTIIVFVGALLPVLLAFMYGDVFFAWAFGEKWRSAGDYAAWTMFGMAFSLANAPSVTIVPLIGWNRNLLIYEVASAVLKCLIVIISSTHFEVYETVIVVSILSAVTNCTLIVALLRRARGLTGVADHFWLK